MSRIQSYSFGHIVVDGEEATNDVIVLPGRVVHNWWRRDGHALVLEDLREVLDELPQRLVVGTGAYGRMRPDPAVVAELRERGIEVEALPHRRGCAPLRGARRHPDGGGAAPHVLARSSCPSCGS